MKKPQAWVVLDTDDAIKIFDLLQTLSLVTCNAIDPKDFADIRNKSFDSIKILKSEIRSTVKAYPNSNWTNERDES